jgi:hypothetical protein
MSLDMPGENTEDIDVPPLLRHKIHVDGAIGLLQLLSSNADRVLTGDQSYIQDQLPPKDYMPALESLVAKIVKTVPAR